MPEFIYLFSFSLQKSQRSWEHYKENNQKQNLFATFFFGAENIHSNVTKC